MPETPTPARLPPVAAVLWDFDGTLGDTEQPAMTVAFWELAPYLPLDAGDSPLNLGARCAPDA